MSDKKSVLTRFTISDYEHVKELAEEYTNGNMTAWIVYASTRYVPSEDELVS